MDDNLLLVQRVVQCPGSGYMLSVILGCLCLPGICHILGLQTTHTRKIFEMYGTTFDDAEERIVTLTQPARGVLFTGIDHTGPDFGGALSLKRILLQIQAFGVLNGDVSEAKAVAWLESLPDNEAFVAQSVTLPTCDYGAVHSMYQFCWIALANEKYSMYAGALRFAELQLETDLLKGGAPLLKWPQVIALACKGRVLAKLGRHDEALVAFQAAISTSKESYSLMAALAYRELANYADGGGAAVQAAVDLEAKLQTFAGRMTQDEFDGLTIGPGAIMATPTVVASTTTSLSTTTESAPKLVLPTGPKTKPLLPNGKHAFLSYQWDVQDQVKEVKGLLHERKVKCWMDIDGGMKSNIYDSMAEGLQGAACVFCFMTQAYQDSANCKLELQFAQQSGVPIIPVMMQADFTAKGWLGILTSGSIWTPMYEKASVLDGVDKLIEQAQHLILGMRGLDDASDIASETSESSEPFDVSAWGDAMFSIDDMREELERLREETAPATGSTRKSDSREIDVVMCDLPAMVPALPRGLFVTAEMQRVMDAVLSDTSTPQIGFCGMGGIGKTTVSCWVTRSDAVRTKFGMVAWITLGQTPALDSCINLLHQQLTSSSLTDGISADQKHEFLREAFRNRSVLLILDDCWDVEIVEHFNWIDHKTNSKVLISSRVRDVLDGGDIVDVNVPPKVDAVKMLLSTAGMDVDALQDTAEIIHIAELCNRLPLTIGVAGKLIRQLAQGSSMSEASDWADVVALLEDEMNDPDGSLSIEERVIHASIKAGKIPHCRTRDTTTRHGMPNALHCTELNLRTKLVHQPHPLNSLELTIAHFIDVITFRPYPKRSNLKSRGCSTALPWHPKTRWCRCRSLE